MAEANRETAKNRGNKNNKTREIYRINDIEMNKYVILLTNSIVIQPIFSQFVAIFDSSSGHISSSLDGVKNNEEAQQEEKHNTTKKKKKKKKRHTLHANA